MSQTIEGKFLIAMPSMADERFDRTVIYVCAHSAEGAMGLVINRSQSMDFADLLDQLDLVEDDRPIVLREPANRMTVRAGGPVDRSRGFVLHSDDYNLSSSMRLPSGLRLTATVEVLRALSRGAGPKRAMMALGYAGWGANQLESELIGNDWLVADAVEDLIFDAELDDIWPAALHALGVDPAFLSAEGGHA